ncbi:DUF1653 domain-containing protein [bacterium]|jgi:hypothetical protein|nr:DUF1653 domain-containing protein [bacterium]MBT5015426.1 DUF1653 domain-containing protein [bacterium]
MAIKPTSPQEQEAINQIVLDGSYRHYKGKMYTVIELARHSETLELMVVYRAEYDSDFGSNTLWVRPLTMFIETIDKPPFSKRFELV